MSDICNCFKDPLDSQSDRLVTKELKEYGTTAEQDKADEDEKKKEVEGCFSKSCIIGVSLLTVTILFRAAGTLTSQMGTGSSNIFLINSVRFSIQTFVAFTIAICTNTALLIKRKYIPIILAWVTTNIISGTMLFFTASFFPVGNLEAVYVILMIFFSTLVDIIRRQTEWPSILKSAMAIIGVVLITQFWSSSGLSGDVQSVPCEYWSGTPLIKANHSSDLTTINNSTALAPQQRTQNISEIYSGSSHSSHYVTINGIKYPLPFDSQYLGYILIMICACVATCELYAARYSKDKIEFLALLFWAGTIEAPFSFLLNIIWSSHNDISVFSFPTVRLCLGFTLMYAAMLGVSNIFLVSALRIFKVTTVAVSYVLITLLLYISQRTFLKDFYPGHANNLEIIGTVITLSAFLVTPVHGLLKAS